jgi:site-specific recombinase XerD
VDNLVRAFAYHLEAVEASGAKPATVTLYDGRYKSFLSFLKAEGHDPPFDLELLNSRLVRKAALWVKENSHGHRGGEHAMRMLVCVLKIGSAWLADEGVLTDEVDPLARVKRPRATSNARLPFTQEDVRAMVSAATWQRTGSRDVALIHLLLDTGMRSGGACSILLADLDLKERRVVLRLKGGRQHVLYFGSSERRDGGHSLRAMKRYLIDRELMVRRWASSPRGDRSGGRLFLSYDGWPLTPKGFHTSLKGLADASGLSGVFPHRFRHTFATWYLVRHPGDETGLRGILGHLSDDMFRVYSHLAHEIIAQRAGRVALSEVWLGDEYPQDRDAPRPILVNDVGSGVGYAERPGPVSQAKGQQGPGRMPGPRTSRRLAR